MKDMGITLIVAGSVLLIMAGGKIFGDTALVVAIIMILAGLVFLGAARAALNVVAVGLTLSFVLALSGCSAPLNTIRQVEVSREAVANNPLARPGSIFLDVNPYTATWVVDRVYRGFLTREQAIGNVNGRVAFYDDYLFKVELTNAIEYNVENSPSVPNVARMVLDPDATYTIVRHVGWGRGMFREDHSLEVFTIRTSRNAVNQCWTNKWGRSECANVVSVAAGSNQSSNSNLDLRFRINGTQIVRDAFGALLGAGQGGR